MKAISEKLGIRSGSRAIFIHAPRSVMKAIGPADVKLALKLAGSFDYIHFFADGQAELNRKFDSLKKHLKPAGALWISWRKGGHETDLALTKIIKIGYDHGLVESKTLSIDSEWSALKFTHPKKGKVYHNSYGNLKN